MWQMADVPQHSAADRACRTDGEIGEGAVERAQSQPGLRGELQGTAEEVSDDIGMADDDLELVLGMRPKPPLGRIHAVIVIPAL